MTPPRGTHRWTSTKTHSLVEFGPDAWFCRHCRWAVDVPIWGRPGRMTDRALRARRGWSSDGPGRPRRAPSRADAPTRTVGRGPA